MARRMLLIAALIAGLVPSAFAQLSRTDKAFVMRAARINNYEIEAALLADKYSSNAAYRQYALTIANDQTEDSGELESAVADEDSSVRLPTGVSAIGHRRLNALKNTRNVDATFRNQIISTETAALRLYQDYIGQPGVNPEIKVVAHSMIPTLQKHLEDAQQLPAG
ncbi:MAG: DUF4142 domain-containing protein [Acidobacteriaceae bacterium]